MKNVGVYQKKIASCKKGFNFLKFYLRLELFFHEKDY